MSPNVPTPRGHVGPSGQVMVIVTDAHTGFIKERYLGPAAPDLSLLGPELNATIPAVTGTEAAGTARAAAAVRSNPKLGFIEGRLIPARVGRLVTLRDTHGHVVDTAKSRAASTENRAGTFTLRESEGHYVISAPRCGRLSLHSGPVTPRLLRSTAHRRVLVVDPEDVVHPGLLGGWLVSKPPVPRRTPDEICTLTLV